MPPGTNQNRNWGYLIAALAGLIAGLALGQVGSAQSAQGSRIPWPQPPVAHPRSLAP